MNSAELYKFSQEGGIGTCISKIDVSSGKDRLPRKAGDIITILKPLFENTYLGSINDVVGHFQMEEVNLVYLNLSSASPKRNPEKYMSFTALLDQKVPTGSILLNNISPFTGPSSLGSSPISTIESTEQEGSLEDIPSDINSVTLTKRTSHQSRSSLPSSTNKEILPLLKHTEPQHKSAYEISSAASFSQNPPKPNNFEENLVQAISKPENQQTDPTPESRNFLADKPLPEISISNSHNEENSNNNSDTSDPNQPDTNCNTTTSQKGLISSFRKLKLKAEEVVNSAMLDPSLMLLPSSKPSSPLGSRKLGAASSANLRQFYKEAQSQGQSMTVDEFGFIVGTSEDEGDDSRSIVSARSSNSSSPNGNKNDKSLKFDLTKEAKWRTIMNLWSPTRARKSYRVKKLVENGIPDMVRGRVWEFLANTNGLRKSGVYKSLLEKEKIPIYDVIERDIRRTYPKHAMFYYESSQGQQELHSILKAYAQYNPDVGYCQGMGMLVGLFLMQGLNAEESFWLLVSTVNQYLQGYFTPNLSQLLVHASVFDKLLEEYDPRLAKHLSSNDITPLLYVTPWFLTVFTLTLPWSSVLRVWDLFYYKGVKILFRVGLAIMTCVRAHILRNCPTNAELLPFLLHIPHSFIEPEPLMAAYKNVRITTSHVQSLCRKVAAESKKAEQDKARK